MEERVVGVEDFQRSSLKVRVVSGGTAFEC